MPSSEDAKRLVEELSAGREGAGDELLPLLYEELHALAGHYMRHERAGHTLQTTALVHEAWLRVCGEAQLSREDQGQFLRVAARAMRQVLVDHARRHHAVKRVGRRHRTTLDESKHPLAAEHGEPDLLDLDRALGRLAALDEQLCQIVELRYFAGLSTEEVAQVFGVTRRTVQRHERMATAWLAREVGADGEVPGKDRP